MAKHSLVNTIDATVERNHALGDPFRSHLGGSFIGRKCERQLWYSFRWAARGRHSGRLLRLFERGHKEEFRFVAYLRSIGIDVFEYSEALWYHPESDSYFTEPHPDLAETSYDTGSSIDRALCVDCTGNEFHISRAESMGVKLKQWRISDVLGHFGGSLDGIGVAEEQIEQNPYLYNPAGPIPAREQFLLEFKTHNDKSFKELVAQGVRDKKPEHFAQMQIYMHKRGLSWAVYMAVNKNDDDLHVEIVEYEPKFAETLLEKAGRIIGAAQPPKRISASASWHECKWCDYRPICHMGEPMERHCRSCVSSTPVENGQWHCSKWDSIIPVDAILKGCNLHRQITD